MSGSVDKKLVNGDAGSEGFGREGDAFGDTKIVGLRNGLKDDAWSDDAASTGTAFREENGNRSVASEWFESDGNGEWAQNLFYAYARRVCLPPDPPSILSNTRIDR